MKLYTTTAVAKEIGVSRTYVEAMKRAGLKYSHGRFHSKESVLDWMAAHPDFRLAKVYPHKLPARPARLGHVGRPSVMQRCGLAPTAEERALNAMEKEIQRKWGSVVPEMK